MTQPGPQPADILAALQSRLLAARAHPDGDTSTWNYPLDAAVLPDTGDGDPGAVRTALAGALIPGATAPLVITATGDPVLAQTVTLTGTSSVLTGDPGTAVTLIFTVGSDLKLAATWTATPPDDWALASAFPALAETPFDYLPVSGATFAAATSAHTDPAFFFPLQAGLQYQATLAVSADLTPATGEPDQPRTLYTRVGGPVQITADGRPRFNWTAQAELPPLVIQRVGQAPLTLEKGTVTLSCTPIPGGDQETPSTDNVLTINGAVLLPGGQIPCALDLPTELADQLTLVSTGSGATAADTVAALNGIGVGDVLVPLLPASLLSLAGVSVTGFTVVFNAAGDDTTSTSVSLGFGSDVWNLVPALNLTVSGLTFTATVVRSPGYRTAPVRSWGAQVSGQLALGGATYAVTAAVPSSGGWFIGIVDTSHVPTLPNLAALTGLAADQVSGVLPESLLALGRDFTLSEVSLLADPAASELSRVAFTIAQTSPWPLAGGRLTLSGWSAGLVIAKGTGGTWSTTGVLQGDIELSAGGQQSTLNVVLPVPIGDGQLWTLGLQPGNTVQLPTVGQVLALFGTDPAALPTGVASFGGLVLTRFTVSVDPAAVSLRHLSFACSQANDWVIIGPDILVVTGVAAGLAFLPAASPVGVAGQITGTLLLAGSPVDMMMCKSDFTGPWQLTAGYENFVHIPGFADMDAWLNPAASAAALPASLPLSAGLDVGEVVLNFSGDQNGALTSFGFTLFVADAWTVLPGYLSLTYLTARLLLPYPVVASQVTGTVAGVVTLAGVDIAVSASKPATNASWEFAGTLLAGRAIDLIGAASSLGSQTLAVPPDAVHNNLPAAITIDAATVRVVPDTGEFHFAGQVSFDWEFTLGSAQFAIRSIGGTIDIPQRSAPLAAAIAGTFDFAGLHTVLTMAIGGASAQTVLTGVVTPQDAANVQIGGVAGIGALGAAQDWAALAPAGLTALTFTGAAVYLNLTTSRFVVYGGISYGSSLAADGMVYLSSDGNQPWTYAVALALGPQFRFGALVPALAAVDDHLKVASATLVVCDLAGQTLGELSTATTALLGQIAPSAPAPLDGLTGQAMALSAGAYFTARIDFQAVSLFSRILQIGHTDTGSSIWLQAVIDSANPAGSTFAADLPDISIAGTILLTRTGSYPGVHLSYTPQQAGLFELAGQIRLTGIFGSGYAFDATLSIDDTGLTSTISQTQQEIATPFGIPGITLSGLGLTVRYVWAVPATGSPQTSSFTLGGHVLLGPAPAANQPDQRLSCAAMLALSNGTPVLFDIALDADFSLGAFIAQCLTGSGANWPGGFIDVTFLVGTRIYYYDAAHDPGHALATLGGITRSGGFNVDARIRLTLVTSVDLHGVLTVLQDPASGAFTGIRAGITLDGPVDLVFVQLAGSTPPATNQPYTGGPVIAFQTGAQASFVLSAGINFLGSAFLAVEVGVSKGADGGTIMTGTLTAAQSLEPFGTLGCGFSYTSHPARPGEFAISGWPDFTWARELVDFMQALKGLADTSSGSPCGTLADFVVSNAYTSSYSISPSVSVAGADVVFALTGSYSLTIIGATSPFLTMTMPAFSVHIPGSIRWGNLPEALAAGFAGASAQFAQDLMNQPDKIALFLAMVVGPQAVATALEFVCNSLAEGAMATAAELAFDAMMAAGGAAAAGAAGAAAAAAAAFFGGGGGGGGGGTGVQTPNFRSLSYASGSVTGVWDAAAGASGYTFELLRPDGSVLAQTSLGLTLTGSLTVDPGPLPAGVYHGQVRGTRGQQAGDWVTLPITKPAGPAPVLSYALPNLTATWPDAGAAGYVVRFYDPAGAQVGSDVSVAGNVLQASVPLPEPVAGLYQAAVQASVSGQFPSAFGNRARLSVLSLAAPQIGQITRSAGVLTVPWMPVHLATGYQVRVSSGGTTLASVSITASPAIVAPSPAVASGTGCLVEVRAASASALSKWSSATFTVWDVPAPGSAELDDVADALVATWAQVTVTGAPAAGYNLQLIDTAAPGTPVGAVSGAAGPTATLTRADGTQPAQGARYAVRVQAVVAGNLGPWATSAPLIVVTLPPPTGVVLQVAGAGFSLTWTAPALPSLLTGPVSYDVALMQGGVPVGTLTGVTGTSAAPSRGDNQTPAAGQAYTAQVRAATPGHASGWAAAAPVIVMDVPQIISASYASGVTRVQWTPSAVPGADYDVDVHQQEVAPGADRVTPVAGPATSASIDMTGLPSWTYNVTVRARTANSVGAWSTAVPIALIDPPAIDAVTYAGTVVTVQFNGNTNARTGFRFTLFRPDGTTAGSWTTSGQMGEYFTTVPAGLVQPGITYTLTAVTLFGAYTSIPSAPVPVALLPLPSAVTLTAMGTVFSLTWTAAPLTGPVSYTVVLMQGSTSVGELDQVTGTSAVPARTDQQIPATGQVYTAKVCTVQNGNTSDWAISAPVTIMDAPSVTSAAYAGGTATVQWTLSSVAGAGYLVTLQQQGAVAGTVPPVTVPGPATSARIDLTGRPNGMYSAAVRATTPGSAGPPSPSAAFAVLDPPGGLAVRYAGTQVTVSWTAAPAGSRFDTYQLTLTGPDGKTTGWRAPSTATSFRLPLGAVQPGTSYSLTAATTVGRYTSALSAAIPVALLAPPTAVTLTATGPAFSLTWTAAQLTGPVSYTVILTQDGTQVAELDQVTGTTAAPTRTDKQAPAAGQVYTASVWAVQDGNTSPSAVSAPVTVMDIPSITSASYPGGVVTVKWTASTITGAGYNVKLQQQDVADGAHVQTAVSQNSVGIDMSGHPRLIYTATVQATMVNSVGTWSAPVPVPVLDPPTGLNVTSLKNSNTVNASWNALPAGSQISFYLLTLRSQSGSGMSAWQVAPPTTTFQIPPSAFQSPLPYTLTVATRAGIYTSMSSPPITVIPPNPAASG